MSLIEDIARYEKDDLPNLKRMKEYYEKMNLLDAIKNASVGMMPDGSMNRHQWRVGRKKGGKGAGELQKIISDIEKISTELLDELKKEKLRVDQWSEKSVTAAAVFKTVSKTLFETLPYPTYQTDEIDLRTNLVYEHLKHQYFGGGVSIYGRY